jgi:fimbrial chaperone protein
MKHSRAWLITLIALLASLYPASAASLRITPISIELSPSVRTTTVRLRNEGAEQVTVQMRIFRWTQAEGEDRLEPTRDVVISPPMAKLLPKRDYVIRIVRLAKTPIETEENYRLLVDELPSASASRGNSVSLLLRQSLPVLFQGEAASDAALEWAAEYADGELAIVASNNGSQRVKLSRLQVSDSSENPLISHEGLSGYVLGGSFKRWSVAALSTLQPGEKLKITARTKTGGIHSYATLRARN